MIRKAGSILAVLVPVGLATAWFLRFFALAGPVHRAASIGLVAVTGTLTAWNFDLASGKTPSWESIGLWVGRGLARVSYVALFGIPLLASLYGAAETAPPPLFLLGYLSSLAFAIATTTHILRTRFPAFLEPLARWTGTLAISMGFHVLVLLFYVQALDVVEAYSKPRRELSLEPARRYVEGLDREAAETVERLHLIHEDIAATGISIRSASDALSGRIDLMGEASEEVRRAALAIQELSKRLEELIAQFAEERRRLEERFRIFR